MSQTLVLVSLNDLKALLAENSIPNEVWGTAEAAKFLECSESQVRTQAGLGKLPGVKIGSEWKFSSIALFQMLQNGESNKGGAA